MNSQQMIEYIKQQLFLGLPQEEIEKVLLLNRATHDEIHAAFNTLGLAQVEKEPGPNRPPIVVHQSNLIPGSMETKPVAKKSSWGWFFLVLILILAGFGVLIFQFRPDLLAQLKTLMSPELRTIQTPTPSSSSNP